MSRDCRALTVVALLWGLFWSPESAPAQEPLSTGGQSATVARGEVLVGLGGCKSCHTGEGTAPFAGGHAIQTTFGTFYGTNITPHPTAGIGAWSDADFLRAMRHGRAPDGRRYWPAFPYASYTQMHDEDLLAIKAFLFSVPPDPRPNQRAVVKPLYRPGVVRWAWQRLYLRPGPVKPEPEKSEPWLLGRYLTETVGHCGECHTPRDGWGGLKQTQAFAGTRYDLEGRVAPNLTPHASGLDDWDEAAWLEFLASGMSPDGDMVGGQMAAVVEHGTARLSDEERRAITLYFLSLPPRPSGVKPRARSGKQEQTPSPTKEASDDDE